MAREIRGTSTGGTLYARLMSPAGLWWNGSSFEAYTAANYANYVITMTEQGNSNVYVGDFPAAILTSGTYDYFVYLRAGASPAEGDTVINTGKIDWSGTAAVTSTTGAMSGSEFRDYILRLGFKRTDKDTEIYEATTDAVQEMRRMFGFSESEVDTTTTDTISVLGDFRLSLESDFGLINGIILQDGTNAHPLVQLSKSEYDRLYPDSHVTSDRGYPKHFCIYAGNAYIGPVPDSTSYTYRKLYSRRAGTITSGTTGVPFTVDMRDVLADNVLSRLYQALDETDLAASYGSRFANGFFMATRKERINKGTEYFVVRPLNI